MKKIFIFLIFIAVILIAGVLFFAYKSKPKDETASICIKNACYEVEIADDAAERARGLMFRESLGEGKGMLFVFDNVSKHSFWMKNTLIPLDIVWLDSQGKIVYISQNTPLCAANPCPSYTPEKPAKYVLEIAAGQAEKNTLQLGDRANIEL